MHVYISSVQILFTNLVTSFPYLTCARMGTQNRNLKPLLGDSYSSFLLLYSTLYCHIFTVVLSSKRHPKIGTRLPPLTPYQIKNCTAVTSLQETEKCLSILYKLAQYLALIKILYSERYLSI